MKPQRRHTDDLVPQWDCHSDNLQCSQWREGRQCHEWQTSGFYYPRQVLGFRYCCCLHLFMCVHPSVCVNTFACPRDNSTPTQARNTRFGPKGPLKWPIVLWADWLWPSMSNLTFKSKNLGHKNGAKTRPWNSQQSIPQPQYIDCTTNQFDVQWHRFGGCSLGLFI